MKLEELIITNNVRQKKDYWFHTKTKFNHADGIDIHSFTVCRSKFRFDRLKRLYFKGSYKDYELLHLNDFTQLEQLTIYSSRYNHRYPVTVVDISLPNLKVLHERSFSNDYDLRLNTPKLEFLRCESFEFMKILHPDSIKHLERDFCLSRRVNLFKNVEYLKFDLALIPRVDDFLSAYPKVKTLLANYYFPTDDDEDEEYSEITNEEFNNEVTNALRQLVKQRPDLTIYFQSVKLDNVKKIDEYDPQKHLAFQINNYDSLCADIFDRDCFVDYNELLRLFNGNLPDDFHKKYFNIKSVAVSDDVESGEHFVEFLKRSEYLRDLSLENVSFNQDFYDRLPEMTRISFLYLGKGVKPIINYDFMFKMQNLKTLQSDRDLKEMFDLASALFSRLKYFRSIFFQVNGESVHVGKDTSKNQYSVVKKKENAATRKLEISFQKGEMNFDELVGFLRTYKNTKLNSNRTDRMDLE